jgi:glycosyltransferase involved in cell wall biosynthesis
MRVGYFGTWERGYPRNEQVISCLRTAGVDVREIHADVWAAEHKFALGARALPRLGRAEWKLRRAAVGDCESLVVGYPGQFDMWAAKKHDLPVVFNAMVSLYDTLVGDRGRFGERSVPGRVLRQVDIRAFRAADIVVADTAANAAQMAELGALDHVAHVYVGAEESLFTQGWRQPERFRVLFVGKLIPLHGLGVIVAAARLLPTIEFLIVGDGQERGVLTDLPPNVEHRRWLEYRDLPAAYAECGCALGIFGSSEKAARVIPNKVFQAMAVGAPVITADTIASRELLTGGVDALLVERTPEALAAAISTLADDPGLAQKIAAAGRVTFERECSELVLGRRWRELLAGVV